MHPIEQALGVTLIWACTVMPASSAVFTSEGMVRAYFARPDRLLVLEEGLVRARVYWPQVKWAARSKGVPEGIFFGVAMCESAFNPFARSRAGAEGMFQFMPATGRLYGLHCQSHRFNVSRSSLAAARHLADLHKEFGCWKLALAAYNAGRGRLHLAERRAQSKRWADVQAFLPEETLSYVPEVMYMAHQVYPLFVQDTGNRRGIRLVRVKRGRPTSVLKQRLTLRGEFLEMLNHGRLVAGECLTVSTRLVVEKLHLVASHVDTRLRVQLYRLRTAVEW